MNPFFVTKRRLLELLIMIVIVTILNFFLGWDFAILFVFGFIWNWVAAQDVNPLLVNRRFKLSMLKIVTGVQELILRPLASAPVWVKMIAKCLPAGIFWSLVILFNDSDMPWYMTFIGSGVFELLQLEIAFFQKQKETLP